MCLQSLKELVEIPPYQLMQFQEEQERISLHPTRLSRTRMASTMHLYGGGGHPKNLFDEIPKTSGKSVDLVWQGSR